MLAGATDVGKSTLCRLLLSYATRLGRKLCLVDCDVGQGSVSIPGTVCEGPTPVHVCAYCKCVSVCAGVLPVETPADIETGEFKKEASLVYAYGSASPSTNFKLYTTLVSSMAHMFHERCKAKPLSERH